MNRWLLAGALAFATASQALASDLLPPAPPPPPRTPAAYVPPVLPVYNWGGLYFGFNVGYGFGKSNWVDARNARQVHHLLSTGALKCVQKKGGRWVASRAALLRELGA
jgi:opacity protein-like surface antigen